MTPIPSCSIVIPTQNRPKLLPIAVASALAAAPPDGEVLIVDDNSAPAAAANLSDIIDPRLRIILNPGAPGVARARNLGLRNARADVVFFLDDDDRMHPHYCAHLLGDILPRHAVDYGHAAYALIKDGARLRRVTRGRTDGVIAKGASFRQQACGFGMGFWIRKSTYLAVGPIDETLDTNEDTEYLLRLQAAGKRAWFSRRVAVDVCLHSGGTDQGHLTERTSDLRRARGFAHILTRHHDFLATQPAMRRFMRKRIIKKAVRARFPEMAETTIRQEALALERLRLRAYFIVHCARAGASWTRLWRRVMART